MIAPIHPLPIDAPPPTGPLPNEAAEAIAALLLVAAERDEQDETKKRMAS